MTSCACNRLRRRMRVLWLFQLFSNQLNVRFRGRHMILILLYLHCIALGPSSDQHEVLEFFSPPKIFQKSNFCYFSGNEIAKKKKCFKPPFLLRCTVQGNFFSKCGGPPGPQGVLLSDPPASTKKFPPVDSCCLPPMACQKSGCGAGTGAGALNTTHKTWFVLYK